MVREDRKSAPLHGGMEEGLLEKQNPSGEHDDDEWGKMLMSDVFCNVVMPMDVWGALWMVID